MGKGKKKHKKKQGEIKNPLQAVEEVKEEALPKEEQEAAATEQKVQFQKEEEAKGQEKQETPPQEEKEIVAQEGNQPEASKTFPWKKFWMIFGGSVFGVMLVVYAAGMIYLHDKFQPNTRINGMDASLHTVEEMERQISDMVGTYELKLEERGGVEEIITADQVGYRYVPKGEVQGFKDSQKLYLWPFSLWEDSEFVFVSSTEFDEEKLGETIKALKCCDEKLEKAPTDAYMKFNGTTYEIAEETQGKKVKKKALKKVLGEAISKSEDELSLEAMDCYAKPAVTKKNKALNRLIKNMNRFAKTELIYKFGEKREVLDGSIIRKWLSYDENGEVTLDEEKVALYVDYLAEEYDTYGKPREFTTYDGSVVTVKGGSYGFLIDREAETAELTELIRSGARRTRVPVYAQAAVSRINSDLGVDYVEVDMTNQWVCMYINGEKIVETDMVSGTYTNPSRRTPPGTYTLYWKKSPAVLKSDKPGDSYENPVTYWMPFNGGIGLHDANWRGSFGGSIYMYSGSHGCINLPTSAAKVIYDNIYKGMPIICYYR
ncbi:peptidoglycan binding domain-containing protein [Lachnospiraceae bacterium 46-15]